MLVVWGLWAIFVFPRWRNTRLTRLPAGGHAPAALRDWYARSIRNSGVSGLGAGALLTALHFAGPYLPPL